MTMTDEDRSELDARERVMKLWAGLVPKLQRLARAKEGEALPALTPLEATEVMVCMATTYAVCEGALKQTPAGMALVKATLERWMHPTKAVS